MKRSNTSSVRRFFREWLQAEQAGDVNQLVDSVTDDCIFLLPGQEPVRGKEEVRRMYERFFAVYKASTIEHTVSIEDVQASGDYSFFWGADELTVTSTDGKRWRARGYGLGILKRGRDRHWKSFRSMNNMRRETEVPAISGGDH